MRLLIPIETESYETKRRRELLSELERLDVAMASLRDDLRAAKMRAGFAWYAEMPSPMKSPQILALELGCNELGRWRNAALQEHAQLV